ncbi:MAG: hypothetical protein MJ246_05425 [Clostridia bacterium]|nr:hypothetical protein [Clostridia bacterium]
MNSSLEKDFYNQKEKEELSDLIGDLDESIELMLEYDKALGVNIPERPVFSEKEIKEIDELLKIYEDKEEIKTEPEKAVISIHEDICPISLAFSDDQDDDFDAEVGM